MWGEVISVISCKEEKFHKIRRFFLKIDARKDLTMVIISTSNGFYSNPILVADKNILEFGQLLTVISYQLSVKFLELLSISWIFY
ncbi:MAG: hypothetical protein WBA93_07970 [Microcoleaceae cyanobacterium]